MRTSQDGPLDRLRSAAEQRERADKPTVALQLRVLHGTSDAWLVQDRSGAQAWLPRQHVAFPGGIGALGETTITVPAWLARKKGLSAGAADSAQRELFGDPPPLGEAQSERGER